MRADERVVVLGEDVVEGGPFALTRGLHDAFGSERVRNTPISEAAVMGMGVGMALAGGRPVIDLMFNDFVTLAADQLFNHAAKIHYMSGGRYSVPLTVWTLTGAGTRWGAQHSQNLAGWFSQVPGLKVLSPCTAQMAGAAVRAAIDDPDPVVLLVDRSLLYSRTTLPHDDGSPWQARVVLPGTDVTVVASGRLVHLALEVSRAVDASVEVIDAQRLAPIAIEPILDSVNKTHRVLILHDEPATGGYASSVAAEIAERAHGSLRTPVRRLTSPPTPIPSAPNLEDAYMVGVEAITRAISDLTADGPADDCVTPS